jgi:iron complex transport system substrate-binding protein
MRIVSLLPSATEIVCALGLADALVGVSGDCDYPPEVRHKPILSETIVTSDLGSEAIDRRIRAARHTGRSVYHLDTAQLARLRPDLILTQELCAVCAPSYTLVTEAAKVAETDARIVSLEPWGLLDILETIRLVGGWTGTADRAEALVGRLQRRIDALTARETGPRLRVACLEWLSPLYVAGHWVPEMVALAGGLDVLGKPRVASWTVAWEEVLSARPEVLVLMPCGFDIPRTRREIALLTARPGWDDLPAVREGHVYLTDASAYFNRPGPRIVDGLAILAAVLRSDISARDLPPGAVERL